MPARSWVRGVSSTVHHLATAAWIICAIALLMRTRAAVGTGGAETAIAGQASSSRSALRSKNGKIQTMTRLTAVRVARIQRATMIGYATPSSGNTHQTAA